MCASASYPTVETIEQQASLLREQSEHVWYAMQAIIPGGVNSPVRSCYAVGVTPLIIESGRGAEILDIDQNRYIDFCMSWGALLHGHAHPAITEAAYMAMQRGSSFGITSLYERDLAQRVVSSIPGIEMVRFVSSGTEATMSAARLARAYTGKVDIIKFQGHYHGHADQFLIHAGSGVHELPHASSQGVPSAFIQCTKTLPFNDCDALHEFFSDALRATSIAAVIVEPIAANMGVVPISEAFLSALDSYRSLYEFVLIFDEVVTGFRVGAKGAQSIYSDVRPDLICLGKIIGGGFPAAAFGGRRAIMELLAPTGPVYQAGTLSGNPVAMAAGEKALDMALSTPFFYQKLHEKAQIFLHPVSRYIESNTLNVALQSIGSMWTLFFGIRMVMTSHDIKMLRNDIFKEYFLYMLEHGVYIPPLHNEAWFISSTHTEEQLLYAAEITISFLSQNKERLQ